MRTIIISSIIIIAISLLSLIGIQFASASTPISYDSESDTAIGTAGATSTASITIGSHSNRIVTANLVYQTAGANVTSVKIGSSSFTLIKTQALGSNIYISSYYLIAPPTGSQNVTVTWNASGYTDVSIGLMSFYNVYQSTPINTSSVNSTNSGSADPQTINITPTHTGSTIVQYGIASNSMASATFSDTMIWRDANAGASTASQYKASPTIGSKNILSITRGNTAAVTGSIAYEILSAPTPSAPVLSKVNTVNSTAINATLTGTVSGATWYQFNAALSGGSTTHINTTKTYMILNNYTAGSKYTFTAFAGNSSGTSSSSASKYNYTKQIAPTSPTASSITHSSARVTVTPPSGNVTGGYKIFYASPASGTFLLYGTTTNNYIDLSSLSGNTQYAVEFASRYAVGTNYSAISSNSTIVSFYTLPNSPTNLVISQTVVNVLHLSWSAPTGNGTVSGYMIERSVDYGASWLTIVSNTGNSVTTYDDTGLTTGNTYTYRISAIQYSGTSAPSVTVSATVLSAIQLNPTGSSSTAFNSTALSFSLTSSSRSSTIYNIFPTYSSSYNSTTGKQAMSWYTGSTGSSTLTKKLGGVGLSTLTLSCNLSNTYGSIPTSNGTNIYYQCDGTASVNHINIVTGVNTHDFTSQDPAGVTSRQLFLTSSHVFVMSFGSSGYLSYSTGNTTFSAAVGTPISNNQKVFGVGNHNGLKYNSNGTSLIGLSGNNCEINYSPTNTTTGIGDIACDSSIPAKSVRYWNGMMIQGVANYASDNMGLFTSSIDVNPYKKALSLPCTLLGVDSTSCVTFILTDTTTNTDYIVILTSTHTYYAQASTIAGYFSTYHYATQSYYILPYTETSSFTIPSPFNQTLKLYGPGSLNTTITKTGLLTLPSGYYLKGTGTESAVRPVYPDWTNDNTNIPLLTTATSLYQIFVTVSNAPTNAAMMVTYPSATINSIAGVWTVVSLDATHSTEFDIPTNACGLVYIADSSTTPVVWNYEGQLCATGVNQKTIAYVNTLPTNFYTLRYGVTDSYTPSTDGLTTSFHTTVPGTTYTVEIKNSTGTVAQSYTFTVPTNATLDTENYNLTGISKPAGLFVSVGGSQVYSAYLGSPFSLASAASFFHQYLSYQGFDLLSFIPLVFAAMFTRNTVGIGAAMTVVLIATLSFLSVVVIPETVVYIGIIIAIISMIGYRAYGY